MKITLEFKDNKLLVGVPDGHKSEEYVEFYQNINGGSPITHISKALQDQAHKELDKHFIKVWK